jgi:hypothetical protein
VRSVGAYADRKTSDAAALGGFMSGIAEPAVQEAKTLGVRPLHLRSDRSSTKARRCVSFPELVQADFIRENALCEGTVYVGPLRSWPASASAGGRDTLLSFGDSRRGLRYESRMGGPDRCRAKGRVFERITSGERRL